MAKPRLVVEDTELHGVLSDCGGQPRSPQQERERGDNVATHENPSPCRSDPFNAGRLVATVHGKSITAKRGAGSPLHQSVTLPPTELGEAASAMRPKLLIVAKFRKRLVVSRRLDRRQKVLH